MCAIALWITILKSLLEIPYHFDLVLNKLKLMVLLGLMYHKEFWLSNNSWLLLTACNLLFHLRPRNIIHFIFYIPPNRGPSFYILTTLFAFYLVSTLFWSFLVSFVWYIKSILESWLHMNFYFFTPSSGPLIVSSSLAHPCRITWRSCGPSLTLCFQENWALFLSSWSNSQCLSPWEDILMPLQCK